MCPMTLVTNVKAYLVNIFIQVLDYQNRKLQDLVDVELEIW